MNFDKMTFWRIAAKLPRTWEAGSCPRMYWLRSRQEQSKYWDEVFWEDGLSTRGLHHKHISLVVEAEPLLMSANRLHPPAGLALSRLWGDFWPLLTVQTEHMNSEATCLWGLLKWEDIASPVSSFSGNLGAHMFIGLFQLTCSKMCYYPKDM